MVNIIVNYLMTIVNSTNDITLSRPVNTLRHKCRFCCCCQEKSSFTLTPLTWRIWWAPNNASRWQMGFNSAFKGLNVRDTLQQTSVATRGLHFAILSWLLSFVQICVA